MNLLAQEAEKCFKERSPRWPGASSAVSAPARDARRNSLHCSRRPMKITTRQYGAWAAFKLLLRSVYEMRFGIERDYLILIFSV